MDARGRLGAEVLAEEDGHAGDVGAGHGGAHLVLDVAVEGVDNTPHRVDRPPPSLEHRLEHTGRQLGPN